MPSLDPLNQPLGTRKARHLLRRASFVYTQDLIIHFSELTPTQALDQLFATIPLTLELPYDPLPNGNPDGFWTESLNLSSSFEAQERKASIVSGWWWYNAINDPTIKFKLSHFLTTQFTVEKANNAGSATDFYDYLRLTLFYSYGNYKTLAKKMTVNNSMLAYLNNTANNKTAPNENYSREFLELFTIGKSSNGTITYTEQDIIQGAKLLTGFKRQPNRLTIDPDTNLPKGYNSFEDHNLDTKTFSASFGNTVISSAGNAAEMDDELAAYVEMIFSREATAKNICRKLYRYFVRSKISEETENDIISPLAQQLIDNGYEIAPVLRRLLASLHFYDLDDTNPNDETIGAIIKSPLQQLSEIATFLKLSIPDPKTNPFDFYITFWDSFVHNTFLFDANMILFDPENVAGHKAYYQSPDYDKNWISASTIQARFKLADSLLDGKNRIYGNEDIIAKITITEVLRNFNIVSVIDDPFILTSELCNALFAQETDTERINYFMNNFLLQWLPATDWTAVWSFYIEANFQSVVDLRLNALLSNILRAPECQMF